MNQAKTKQPIYAIAAMGQNRVIGNQNQLPWHLPADLAYFKKITSGSVVIMGRKTYTAIGKKLPNRINIIVTRDMAFDAPGCLIAHSLPDAIELARTHDDVKIFIIGGSEIYREALPYIHKIYLTIIHHDFHGDAFFPELATQSWHETSREEHAADAANPYAYAFVEMESTRGPAT